MTKFEFEGQVFEIRAEEKTGLGGTSFTSFVVYKDGKRDEDIRPSRDLNQVKIRIIETYETVNSESYKAGMAAAEAVKGQGREAQLEAIKNAMLPFLES